MVSYFVLMSHPYAHLDNKRFQQLKISLLSIFNSNQESFKNLANNNNNLFKKTQTVELEKNSILHVSEEVKKPVLDDVDEHGQLNPQQRALQLPTDRNLQYILLGLCMTPLRTDWFKRRWVVQEWCLSQREPPAYIGPVAFDLRRLYAWGKAIAKAHQVEKGQQTHRPPRAQPRCATVTTSQRTG